MVRLRFVHRTVRVVRAARHPSRSRRLPPAAHGDVSNAQAKNCHDRCNTPGHGHRSPRSFLKNAQTWSRERLKSSKEWSLMDAEHPLGLSY
jgi:hypothetical protein